MRTSPHRIMAVIDPTRRDQWSLRKAIMITHGRKDIEICAYLCAWSDAEADSQDELRNAELRRHELWLQELLTDFRETGVNIKPVIDWNENWRDGIVSAVEEHNIELIVKRASGRPQALGSSDRQLIRAASVGILLVKQEPKPRPRIVLAALNFNAEDHAHQLLNEAIVEIGNRILGVEPDAEVHVVSAYPESERFVHPPDIAKKLNIKRSHAHARQGRPADIIGATANEIGADLVIIGNVGRRGLSGISIGNTAEKILKEITSDVLIINREGRVQADNKRATEAAQQL